MKSLAARIGFLIRCGAFIALFAAGIFVEWGDGDVTNGLGGAPASGILTVGVLAFFWWAGGRLIEWGEGPNDQPKT